MTTPPIRRDALVVAESRIDLSDAALVERVRTGDVAAFEAMFHAYWDQLYRFAFRYLQSADEAEEAVQTVFARVWRSRADLNVRGPLMSYLYLATRNASRDRLKQSASARSWRERAHGMFPGPAEPEAADLLLRTAEIEASIERALAELPAKRRAICELWFTQDLSYAEIARRLDVSPKTVETQISRGIKFLRERLRQFLD